MLDNSSLFYPSVCSLLVENNVITLFVLKIFVKAIHNTILAVYDTLLLYIFICIIGVKMSELFCLE